MRTYSIDYTEVYSTNYEVEANTLEEATEKLREDILIGDMDGPDYCIDTCFEDVTEYDKKIIELTNIELKLLSDCVIIALNQYNKAIEILGHDETAVKNIKESRSKYQMLLYTITSAQEK